MPNSEVTNINLTSNNLWFDLTYDLSQLGQARHANHYSTDEVLVLSGGIW
jgi:hypothetical protein